MAQENRTENEIRKETGTQGPPLPPADPEHFPESEELPEGVRTVRLKDAYGCHLRFLPNVVYADRSGMELHLQLFLPEDSHAGKTLASDRFYTGIRLVPPGYFRKPSGYRRMGERGYAMAVVEYSPATRLRFRRRCRTQKLPSVF